MRRKAKQGLNIFDKIVRVFNWVCAIAIVISYFAPGTNPQKLWPVALFGIAYTPLLIANLAFGIYWLVRNPKYALLSAVCILLGYQVLPNTFGFHLPSADGPKADSRYLRVMEYNVHSFTSFQKSDDTVAKTEMMQLIGGQSPDVITIQEFFTKYKGEFDTRDTLKKIFKGGGHYFKAFETESVYAQGLAIFSKYPIIDTGLIDLSGHYSDNNAIYADIKTKSGIVRIYCIHLQSFVFDPDDYKYINKVSPNAKHDLKAYERILMKLKNGFITRSRQVVLIKQHAAKCPYPYVFTGDFNDTPSSYAVAEMSKGLQNAFREKGSGLAKTYNGDFPNFQIDYILASRQFKVINFQVVERKLSDHYPIRSDLLLK